jgi:hypothetical protein
MEDTIMAGQKKGSGSSGDKRGGIAKASEAARKSGEEPRAETAAGRDSAGRDDQRSGSKAGAKPGGKR